jgi:hypothetical protein
MSSKKRIPPVCVSYVAKKHYSHVKFSGTSIALEEERPVVLIDKKNVRVIQKYRRVHRPNDPKADDYGYVKQRAGKEYWLRLSEEVLVCRRSDTIWGFIHQCEPPTSVSGGHELRKSRGGDTHMKCTNWYCGKKFDPRHKLIALAKATYPDIGTVKFIAGLAKMCGD